MIYKSLLFVDFNESAVKYLKHNLKVYLGIGACFSDGIG